MSELREKDIYIYRLSEPDRIRKLKDKLENVYCRRFDEKSLDDTVVITKEISELLYRLKFYSDLNGLEIYILEYYLNFLPLDERLNILREVSESAEFSEKPITFRSVRVQSGAGIYRQIDRMMKGESYRIIEVGCGSEGTSYDFVYDSCPFADGTRICYK